jgi:hypothetical protein
MRWDFSDGSLDEWRHKDKGDLSLADEEKGSPPRRLPFRAPV